MQKNIWIAAKYLRLSIEDGDKAESESIVNQSILIDNYMKSTSDITIVETFKDDGFSGTDFKRPGFQAMLKAIENKEINCIIVKDLSRFGREHIDVDRYIQKVFPQLGVRFIAINDNYDSETANITDTHLVLPVKSFVNDTYCRQNSQKVRSHLSAKRNIGEYVGNYVSYGYKKCDADKSQIEIDPVAAKHVRDDDQILELRNKVNKYYKLLHSLSGNLASGVISRDDYALLRERYQTEIKSLESNIEKQEEYMENLLENKLLCEEWVNTFLEKPSLGDLDRDMLLQYVEKINVFEGKKIEIVYRFQDELVTAARLAEQIGKTKQEVAV